LLAFIITLVGAGTILVKERLEDNEAILTALDPTELSSEAEIAAVRSVFEGSRFLFSLSVPLGYLNEYEEALASLGASVLTKEASAYAAARAEAIAALLQIKRSALFSLEQIL